ncbi:jg10898 [Pararge aegeria aegeria]|uniref:Jg10898 protein n=1 Tax=Pararge aegeria aegeria TaxID=348720 RepID=A0A8S4SKV4_9NEOP|nr:jg10898 [Pararge aegeria aegeria]
MAIVEDEVRNGSEEENEIEVVVEEDDGDQDSDDSDDDDDDEAAIEKKVADLVLRIADDPYNYNDHIDLIQALWSLSELDRWRSAFDRLQKLSLLRAEHWLLRLQTEETLAHTPQSREHIANLFQQATIDCYSIPILSEWCSWSMTAGEAISAREQLDEVLSRAGADPLSGKIFWDAKLELEKAKLETMNEEHPSYKEQKKRVLWCLEEAVSRPLLRSEEAWPQLQELAVTMYDQEYVDKVKKQHDAALEYLQKISPFEDRLLTTEDAEEKCKVYQEYIDTVKELSHEDKYSECDSRGILKVLYDRATTECLSCEASHGLLLAFVRHVRNTSSRATIHRVLELCARRCPRKATFWILKMQQAEHENKGIDEVKSIFESALSKGMDSYKQAEALWLSYLEQSRRRTDFATQDHVDRLRRTFRLAWDSLAEAWGDEANDSEIPLFWARLEYKRIKDPAQGKEIFEEIFKYGENKTLSKYWEALINLERTRDPPAPERKLRDLHKRALRCVNDYPPAVARMWTDYERDFGQLATGVECAELCEEKLQKWRESYQAMKDKMIGQKKKGKQIPNKKPKVDNKKKKDEKTNKGKRKSDDSSENTEVKRKKDADMEVDVPDEEGDTGGGVKRSHDEDEGGMHGAPPTMRRAQGRTRNPVSCSVTLAQCSGLVDSTRILWKTKESVDKAVEHDRTPLDGRPMFLSRYSATKSKPTFKYAMTTERNKLFVRNLPYSHCTKEALTEIFEKFGKLKDVRVVTFKDGKPKGLAYIDYEEEKPASEALDKTNGLLVGDRKIEVAVSAPPPKQEASTSVSLGLPKRDVAGGMRRTQLSSFIPRVLQTATTSTSTSKSTSNGSSHENGAEKRPLSNTDFRNMLLNK